MHNKILVFAYSQLGYDALNFLINNNENIVGLVSHQDKEGETIWFDDVKKLAHDHNIPVFTPETLKDESVYNALSVLKPDLIFSFYYRLMIPNRYLDLSKGCAFNMHGSLLPKYRGRCPVNWAILHGETETGATLHQMVQKADQGYIVDQEKVLIDENDTAGLVTEKVNLVAINILKRQIDNIKKGTHPRIEQDHSQASYFGGRTPKDGEIDWNKPASDIHNLIRCVAPASQYPPAFGMVNGKTIYCLKSEKAPDIHNTIPGTLIKKEANTLWIACGVGSVLKITNWTK